uniref:Uncharacterized protein n=1 Tax=Glossina palpalis gambiensis TaxID=67801 RepID=A0A1B0BTL3_9MUSC
MLTPQTGPRSPHVLAASTTASIFTYSNPVHVQTTYSNTIAKHTDLVQWMIVMYFAMSGTGAVLKTAIKGLKYLGVRNVKETPYKWVLLFTVNLTAGTVIL